MKANKPTIVNAVICIVVSGIMGFIGCIFVQERARWLFGIAFGTVTVYINLILLGIAVGIMVKKDRISSGLVIHCSRFLIYGVTLFIAYGIGNAAILGYAASVVSLPVAMCVISLRKEGANGKL